MVGGSASDTWAAIRAAAEKYSSDITGSIDTAHREIVGHLPRRRRQPPSELDESISDQAAVMTRAVQRSFVAIQEAIDDEMRQVRNLVTVNSRVASRQQIGTPESRPAKALADELAVVLLDAHPLDASLGGFRDKDDQLPDYSLAADEVLRARLEEIVAALRAIDPAVVAGGDKVARAVALQQAEAALDGLHVRAVEYAVSDVLFAPATGLLALMPMVGIAQEAHADGYLARLARIPEMLAGVAERYRIGIEAGRRPVRRVTATTIERLDHYLADPASDALRVPQPPPGAPYARQFLAERDRLLADVVYPSIARHREVLADEVLPYGRADDRTGLCWLPGGEEFYIRLARLHTTTNHTPDELCDIGLQTVEQLSGDLAEVGARALGTTNVAEIVGRLRNDPALRWNSGEELLTAAQQAIDRANDAAPGWFGMTPTHDCLVAPIPATVAPTAPAAYYRGPALDGSRQGTFFVNTHEAEGLYRFDLEALAFHEGVPGHHLQRATNVLLSDLPLLQRTVTISAYTEGWALYAEQLADEMGLYSDDLAHIGRLSSSLFRAARLVVDTGLHARGWTRQRAVDYMHEHTAVHPAEIETEVDRYIGDPGQALSYAIGEREIFRSRAEAHRALGSRFDIREFHDVVLGHGVLPMSVLNEVTRDWVQAVQTR